MNFPYCAGMISGGLCPKHTQCALYRLWWETPGTDMLLCTDAKYSRFVPTVIGQASPVAVATLPIWKTMELFA